MATYSTPQEGFYDDPSGRSPSNFRQPSLNRQNQRQHDAYGSMQGAMFGGNNNMPALRFENIRDDYGGQMQSGGPGNNHFPYNSGAAQTWSSSNASLHAFGNGMGNMPHDGNFGPARSVKPSRGRAGVANVSVPNPLSNGREERMANFHFSFGVGTTNKLLCSNLIHQLHPDSLCLVDMILWTTMTN